MSAGEDEMCQELYLKLSKVAFVVSMRAQSSLQERGAFWGSEEQCERGEAGRSWASDELVVRP